MKNARFIILLIYLFIISLTGILLWIHGKTILQHLSQVEWTYFTAIILLNIPFIALGGLAFQILCISHNIPLHWKTWLGLSFIASFINQLLPFRAGMAFRYFYLHRHHQMQPITFLTVMSMYFVLMLMMSAGITLLGWYISDLPETFSQLPLLAGSVLIALVLVFFLINQLRKLEPRENSPWLLRQPLLFQWVSQCKTGCVHLFSHPLLLLAALICFLAANLINATIVYLTFLSFESPIAISDCLFLAGLIQLTMIFPLTPGNIGILEMIFGTITQMLYQDFSLGFSVIALFRACNWIPSIALGSLFSFWLAGSFLPPSLQRLRLGSERQLS